VKCADELVLLVEEEMAIQGMTDTLIKVGRGHGVEMNGEKTKVKRISWQPSPVQNMINQKHLENMEYLSNLGSLIMNGALTCEIKSRMSMTKAVFNNKSHLRLNLRKELLKCYIWIIAVEVVKCIAGEGWRRSIGPTV